MDRRQKRTKQAICDAFTNLLEKKSYSNITVQDIIDEADIGRSTFYSHFETKDELLNDICSGIFSHVFSDNLTIECTHNFSSKNKDIKNKITHILYHLQDNKKYIKRILSCESGEILMRYFKEHLEKAFSIELKGKTQKIPQSYILNHLVCDFAETVRWWMKNEQYTPEEISRFFLKTTLF